MSDVPDPRTPEAVLFSKIAAVMGEVGRVEKRGHNSFHGYNYVTEADLVDEVRAKLAARSVALIPSVQHITERDYQTEKGKHSVITTVTIAFTFVDGESGAMFRAEWAGQGDDPADKGLYSAYTGALKYFLMKTFLIPTGDDPEANSGADERSQDRTQSGPRRSAGGGGGKPSEKQLKYLKSLIAQHHPLKAQITAVLPGVEVDEGWTDKLSKGQCSTLIEAIKDGNLPPVPETPVPDSDIPEPAAGEFVHQAQPGGDVPFESAA